MTLRAQIEMPIYNGTFKIISMFLFSCVVFLKKLLAHLLLLRFEVGILRKKNGEIIRINTFEILTKSDFAIFAWCVSRNYAYCPFVMKFT